MQLHNSVDTERLILQPLPGGSGQTKWPGKRIFFLQRRRSQRKTLFFFGCFFLSRRAASVAEQRQNPELVENSFVFIRFTRMQRA